MTDRNDQEKQYLITAKRREALQKFQPVSKSVDAAHGTVILESGEEFVVWILVIVATQTACVAR